MEFGLRPSVPDGPEKGALKSVAVETSFVAVRKDARPPGAVSVRALKNYYEGQCERAAMEGVSLIMVLPEDEKSWETDVNIAMLETLRENHSADDQSGREPLLDERFEERRGCGELFELGRARARVAVQTAIMFGQTNRFGVSVRQSGEAKEYARRLRDEYNKEEATNDHYHLKQKKAGAFSAGIVKMMHRQSLQNTTFNTAAYEYGCFGCLSETYPGLKIMSRGEMELFASETESRGALRGLSRAAGESERLDALAGKENFLAFTFCYPDHPYVIDMDQSGRCSVPIQGDETRRRVPAVVTRYDTRGNAVDIIPNKNYVCVSDAVQLLLAMHAKPGDFGLMKT